MPTATYTATNGTGQIHTYAGGLSNTSDHWFNLDFANITQFSHGHHVRQGGGNDTANFTNLQNVDDVIVGRLEDFDPSRDTIAINGSSISLSQLESGSGTTGGYSWRIVEYDADDRDSATSSQQWILIDTGQGYVFYALSGARVTDGDGASNGGRQEAHFIGASGGHKVTASELANLPTVGYVDPVDYVPDGYTPQGGDIINDIDADMADVLATINGTGQGDLIAAGLNDDTVSAGGGDDYVWGGSGDDSLLGNAGNDTMWGGAGNDTLRGYNDHDHLYGDAGNDKVYGYSGNDRLWGGDGNDVMNGHAGNDRLWGEDDNDRLYGSSGNDKLYGGNGNDKLFGGTENDLLRGQAGNDLINGGAGRDTMRGESGNDVFEFKTGDLVNWADTSGTVEERSLQLDLIYDFVIGEDKIEFDNFAGVDSRADLKAWKTVIDGNTYFTVQVRDTNERILVDVEDSVSWSQFFTDSNFDFV